MPTAKLSFCVAASGPELGLVVRLDHEIIYDSSPGPEPAKIEYEFDDSQESEHSLTFEMYGKLPTFTQINDAGEIIEDRCVMITDIAFDDIQLGYTVTEVASYHHDTNGTTGAVTDTFYGIMGCNGCMEIKFRTPIYLWLLENM
jgi:hypothetical protein